jgi:uncharacterized membrane protein YqiK
MKERINMENIASYVSQYWWVGLIVLALIIIALNKLFLRLLGVVIIPNDCIGIINKKFVLVGKNKTLPDGTIVALNGEAGIQADTLAPGLHFWLWPWQFTVNMQRFTTIQEGQLGVVDARDGKPLRDGHVLAKRVDCDSYQDARKFLSGGGERGPQITIIPPGTYRINTMLFTISMVPVMEIPDHMVGIVTTKEGKPLERDEIAGKVIEGHTMYQDAQTFLDNGGCKGLQEQVMLAGRYFLNPRFATVEKVPMTTVEIAHVGVVISYVGDTGVDVTGDTFKHGNLVKSGQKGVWVDPLDPGMYPINTRTHSVEFVPTANVVLNWATGKTESHKLDEKLSTITVRSSDGFTFNLDVSQIIHIPRNDAPKVIARFGSVTNLVTQVLEPTIGNYFRNAAQNSDAIEFLKKRSERQKDARTAIQAALTEYNVGAIDTLIGDITPPPELMKTLTDRKIAEQEEITYATQKTAEVVRKDLEQARSMANTQAKVVDAERTVVIEEFKANAKIKTAEGDAKSKTINADADATVLKVTGEAEGAKINSIGTAEAGVIQKKVDALQSGNYAAIEVAKHLSTGNKKWVPEIMVVGGADGKAGGIVDVLLAQIVAKGVDQSKPAGDAPTSGADSKKK